MAKIIICHPGGEEDKFGLQGAQFSVGRAEGNDIVLRDDASSSQHALLELQENGEYAVVDLESTNHTRVNGQKVTSKKTLQHEDRILFGDTLAIYHATTPDAAPAAPEEPAVEEEKPKDPAPTPPPPPPPAEKPAPEKGGSREAAKDTTPPGGGCLGALALLALPAAAFWFLR